jgi:hypothetical protein
LPPQDLHAPRLTFRLATQNRRLPLAKLMTLLQNAVHSGRKQLT